MLKNHATLCVKTQHFKEECEKKLLKNVTKIHKRTPGSKINRINIEAKNIVTKLRTELNKLNEGNVYITVKDHKEELPEKPSFKLINPSKSWNWKKS